MTAPRCPPQLEFPETHRSARIFAQNRFVATAEEEEQVEVQLMSECSDAESCRETAQGTRMGFAVDCG